MKIYTKTIKQGVHSATLEIKIDDENGGSIQLTGSCRVNIHADQLAKEIRAVENGRREQWAKIDADTAAAIAIAECHGFTLVN
jgi:hypothetical protein